MDQTSARVEEAEIAAELAQNANPVDARVWVYMAHAFHPTLHYLTGDGLARLEFAHEKAVQIKQDFLTAEAAAAARITRLGKRLQPRGQWAAKKTRRHSV